jgi:nucleoid DNA-binding protein
MSLKEFSETISVKTKVEPGSVQKVLHAAFADLSERMTKEERCKVPGFGTFVKKTGKQPGKSRISFKPWPSKDERVQRKEKKQLKKAKAEPAS